MNSLNLSKVLLILFLATSIVPIIGIIAYGKSILTSIYIENTEKEMSAIADIKVNTVETYISNKVHLLEYQSVSISAITGLEKLSPDSSDSEYLSDFFDQEEQKKALKILKEHFTEIAKVEGIHDVFLISKHGDIVFTLLNESDMHTNLYTGKYRESELAHAFSDSLDFITTRISGVRFYAASKNHALFITTPVIVNGEIKGVIAFQLAARSLVEFISNNTGMGITGESIIRKNKEANDEIVGKNIPQLFQQKESNALRLGVLGYSGQGVTVDYRYKQVVASWRYLPSLQWGLVVKKDLDEALAPLEVFLKNAWIIISALLLALVLLASVISRKILTPITHLKSTISTIITSGSLRKLDAIGFKEAQDLTFSFNQLIIEIMGYQQNLESIVEEKTKDLKRASYIIDSTHQAIVITNSFGEIIDVNPAYCELFGYSKEELIGKNPNILSSSRQSNEFYKDMWDTLLSEGKWSGEVWNKCKTGEIIPILLNISSISEAAYNSSYFVGILTNIEKLKEQEEILHQMAYYDPLTSLPNRQLMYDRLRQNIKFARRYNVKIGVMFIDLDRFKAVNDSLGHSAGDQLLKEVSIRLDHEIRSSDSVARIGGDEFVVLLNDIKNTNDVGLIAQNIIKSVSKVVKINQNDVYVGASIGVAFYPEDGEDIETLLSNADIALYTAKEAGRGTYRSYSGEEKENTAVDSLKLESELRQVLTTNQFQLYFQPQVDAKTGELVGAEALIRWNHPEQGFIAPDLFIPIAESTGYIGKIDRWVLQKACEQIKIWQKDLSDKFCLSINLSARYFMTPGLITDIQQFVIDAGINPKHLELEVTERTVMRSAEYVIDIMNKLQAMKLSLSIDDFGTGYSSLSYLKAFPISTLKIDKSFVDGVPNDESDAAIVKTIINLAKSLNLITVAEGVETEEQKSFLAKNNCDIIQGYLFSKPLSVEQFTRQWLNERG
ncbi:MAG: EAL domain-containing protein [Gammaproteobacteria bacterium]|nr:EAL domain-containing protein [Gammaproteobacteria bacterium]